MFMCPECMRNRGMFKSAYDYGFCGFCGEKTKCADVAYGDIKPLKSEENKIVITKKEVRTIEVVSCWLNHNGHPKMVELDSCINCDYNNYGRCNEDDNGKKFIECKYKED